MCEALQEKLSSEGALRRAKEQETCSLSRLTKELES